ncbi:MAG: SDR family NAD(P)-dependent oxidoreductase [bacterium]|nr:SDR family NAD(P)-dependent oxidoreductase [bacterium]
MDQKVAVITGAGAGMGRSFALRLAEEGAKVAVVDLAVDEAEETVRLVNESGGTARAYEADVTDLESLEAAVESIVNDFGSITTLVNNAGVLDGYAMLAETDEELWDKVMSVDLKGPFLASQACLPHLQASGNATIINIASVAALRPGGGGITYSTAKTGVLGLTRMIQHACGPEIRCNAILPGIVQTEMVEEAMNDPEAKEVISANIDAQPARRLGQPEEVANAVLFLASDESSYIYGVELIVDGGWMLR